MALRSLGGLMLGLWDDFLIPYVGTYCMVLREFDIKLYINYSII